jgi:uncharacterized NAD-dependent epimerase/dehydratase family protein
MPTPEKEAEALEILSPGSKVIALSINCKGAENYVEICKEYENRTGLLTVDVIADPNAADKLLDKILDSHKSNQQ